MPANYKNFQHYIDEGWSKNPKEIFKFVDSYIANDNKIGNINLLDIGCATGEFIYYLSSRYPAYNYTGIDVFDDLIEQCNTLQPNKTFIKASALDLPKHLYGQFDFVTAVGVMSIFDEDELPLFLDNLIKACRENGVIYILSPLNEFGVDCVLKHRKWKSGNKGSWEKGWNIYSQETLSEILQNRCKELSFHPFKINFDLPQRDDKIRTWTMKTENNDRQLTNGLKLLVDHYLIKIVL
ncbi:class I SAM-dependent methyltransferase [Legionella sp. W05-934-2]|uniref:class I SAM-dependent methyltransferase n=1 Tax=Legionella sp. W05-934-2 TaxID=1198649 RepID=UPI003462A9AB